jgi:hypothetical protein
MRAPLAVHAVLGGLTCPLAAIQRKLKPDRPRLAVVEKALESASR